MISYDTEEHTDSGAGRLLREVTCPNCWHKFPPENILFIARHESLIGDSVVGPNAFRRFKPSRFTVAGDAVDAQGMVCQQLACPRCHLEIARPLVELTPFFISIVGAPSSGKSYFLASMTWQMRAKAPGFGFTIADGDPTANYELQRYEEMLFMNAHPDTPVALRKTEIQGTELYQSITLDGQTQSFPRPFQFTLNPVNSRDNAGQPPPSLSLVLYDNAGEHFLPGSDATSSPVTLHLAESAAMCFVFDPVQDPRFRARCHSDDPQLKYGTRPGAEQAGGRQEVILNEMIARVRRYKGLSQTARHRRPLVMILSKADLWMKHEQFDTDPFIEGNPNKLNLPLIDKVSDGCRKIMQETCPEIVSAAESFSPRVIYIPVSSLGTAPELVEKGDTKFYGIRPSNINPKWTTVPLLWSMSQLVRDLVKTTSSTARKG